MQLTTTGEQTHLSGHFSNLVTLTLGSATFEKDVKSSSSSMPRYVDIARVIKPMQITEVNK
jgi:hypothetical protein